MKPIETQRLTIRPFLETDLDDLYNLLSNPEVMKYYPSTLDKKEAKEWMERNWKREQDFGHSLRAIIRKKDSVFVGQCGLVTQDIEGKDMVEVGYMIRNDLWRQGYATEALRKILDFSFTELELHRIEADCATGNTGSIKVLEKVGMTREGLCRKILPIRGEWVDNYMYAILDTD